jgi:hypothetical protein
MKRQGPCVSHEGKNEVGTNSSCDKKASDLTVSHQKKKKKKRGRGIFNAFDTVNSRWTFLITHL